MTRASASALPVRPERPQGHDRVLIPRVHPVQPAASKPVPVALRVVRQRRVLLRARRAGTGAAGQGLPARDAAVDTVPTPARARGGPGVPMTPEALAPPGAHPGTRPSTSPSSPPARWCTRRRAHPPRWPPAGPRADCSPRGARRAPRPGPAAGTGAHARPAAAPPGAPVGTSSMLRNIRAAKQQSSTTVTFRVFAVSSCSSPDSSGEVMPRKSSSVDCIEVRRHDELEAAPPLRGPRAMARVVDEGRRVRRTGLDEVAVALEDSLAGRVRAHAASHLEAQAARAPQRPAAHPRAPR